LSRRTSSSAGPAHIGPGPLYGALKSVDMSIVASNTQVAELHNKKRPLTGFLFSSSRRRTGVLLISPGLYTRPERGLNA
jgi:hypothetical protein